jgi:MFS family permease
VTGAAGAHAVPHPVRWLILYLPFGAFTGFIQVALTYLATRRGISITEGALLTGANLLTAWLKWLWAPLVDITLTPKTWYWISTAISALAVFLMAAIDLSPRTLPLLIGIILVSGIVNNMVGMAVESIMGQLTPPDQAGRTGAWFQAGNLGGTGLGGGLGLYLMQALPAPWMSGAILGVLFILCGLPLLSLPDLKPHVSHLGVTASVKSVVQDIRAMAKTSAGQLAAVALFLPMGTGAAQTVLTQASVASLWGASSNDVALVQGLQSGLFTMLGCFVGGYACQRLHPRMGYALFGIVLATIAALMALSPATVTMYVVWNMAYSFGTGLSYAGFTAVVLNAMGTGSAATKYNVFASISNFPIWWLGLLLGVAADWRGPRFMLLTEAVIGLLAVATLLLVVWRSRQRPDASGPVAGNQGSG